MYICANLVQNQNIQAIHLGQASLDYYGRLFLRHILNAEVKYPFRQTLTLTQFVPATSNPVATDTTNSAPAPATTDQHHLIMLNSYLLSNLPPRHGLDGEEVRATQPVGKDDVTGQN